MFREINLTEVREAAEKFYKSGDLSCSEAIVSAIMKHVDPKMPKAFIPVASGFAEGVGGTQCMCSTISAAVLCLGYFFGRDFPTTITDPKSIKTLEVSLEMQEYFRTNNKVSCCSVLRKGMKNEVRPAKCVGLVGDMAEKTAQIVAREYKIKIVEINEKKAKGIA